MLFVRLNQVLLRVSVHVAISLYSVVAIVAGIMSILLPIETKGREMTVSLCCVFVRSPAFISMLWDVMNICWSGFAAVDNFGWVLFLTRLV